jgi:hypothetical protein
MTTLISADPTSRQDAIAADIAFLQTQMHNFSAFSIVAMALRVLNETNPRTIEDIQTFPWITLLLAKWALQNPHHYLYLGKTISRQEFDQFRQRIWDMTGEAKRGAENGVAMMRSLLPSQLEFQRRAPWAFMRWPSLIARLPSDHPSRLQFQKMLSLSPEEFIDACWIISPPIVGGQREIKASWINGVPPTYRGSVLQLLNLLGGDFLSLRERMSASWASYRSSSWELFELPFARRYPFYQTSDKAWKIWHPAMFERALEDAAHLILSPLGSAYTESFSLVFEEYVVELARDLAVDLIDERTWKKEMGHNAPAVEAILAFGPVNVFIESKMSLYRDAVLIEDIPAKLISRLERVISAISQGKKVSSLLRERPRSFPQRAEAVEEYLIVVTSREVHLGGGVAISRLVPESDVGADSQSKMAQLPLEHIFVLSIEAFERLHGVIRANSLDLVTVLRDAAEANGNGETSAMYFEDHIKKYVSGSWSVSPLIKHHRNAAMERIKAAFAPV